MEKVIKEGLEKEFDAKFVKKLDGKYGYIEAQAVFRRANDVLGNDGWQVEILEREREGNVLMVWGRVGIKIGENGIVWKGQVGSAKIKYYKDTDKTPDDVIDIGRDWKAATTDMIKKCLTLFGIALYLYGDMEEYTDPEEVYATIIASVQKGEELIAPLLDGTINDYRVANLKQETLTAGLLQDLEAYYKLLLKDYKELTKAGNQAAGGGKDGSEQPPDKSTGNTAANGDLISLRQTCAQAKSMAEAGGATGAETVTLMTKIFGEPSWSKCTDSGKLADFIDRVSKLGDDSTMPEK